MNRATKIDAKLITAAQSFLLVVLSALMLGLMGWLLGGASFAIMAVGGVIIIYLMNPMVPPQVILRLQKVHRLDYHEAPQLYDMLQKLSEHAQLPQTPILYYSPSDMMNAFTIGNPENAAIAVTEGLLRTHPPTKERVRRLLGNNDHPTSIDSQAVLPIRRASPRILWRSPRWLLQDI